MIVEKTTYSPFWLLWTLSGWNADIFISRIKMLVSRTSIGIPTSTILWKHLTLNRQKVEEHGFCSCVTNLIQNFAHDWHERDPVFSDFFGSMTREKSVDTHYHGTCPSKLSEISKRFNQTILLTTSSSRTICVVFSTRSLTYTLSLGKFHHVFEFRVRLIQIRAGWYRIVVTPWLQAIS